jgi:hypothetical protein
MKQFASMKPNDKRAVDFIAIRTICLNFEEGEVIHG